MKIIHCADLHLDSKMDSVSSEKSKIIREEQLNSFEKMCDFAKDKGVCAVIIAGDMFDSSKISNKTKLRIYHAIKKAENTDFLYLTGNHDEKSALSVEDAPDNLKFFGSEFKCFSYGDVCVFGINLDKTNDSFFYDALKPDKDKFNIVAIHGQVVGYKGKSEADIISIPKLKDKNIDYLALGHIHAYSEGKIDDRGKYVYSGCLIGRGFDETGEKGFVLLDIENKRLSQSFIKCSVHQFYEKEIDVSSYNNFYEFKDGVLKELKSEFESSSLIKIVLTGEHSADFILDKAGLESFLSSYFFFVKTVDKTKLKVDLKDFEADKTVKGEFVREVLSSKLSDEDKNLVLLYGLNALKGEDL